MFYNPKYIDQKIIQAWVDIPYVNSTSLKSNNSTLTYQKFNDMEATSDERNCTISYDIELKE